MLKRIRPTASGVIAMIALLMAMSGGAYAAKKYLITSTKQISPSVLKSLKGASGKVGAAGAAGPAGPAGPVGGAGSVGTAGTAGTDGKEGSVGKDGAPGKNGTPGKDGSPWTAGGTLPKGSTETGVWVMGPVPSGASPSFEEAAISFPIPLASAIENAEKCGEAGQPACLIHIFEGTTIPAGCSGTPVGSSVTGLKADSGNFCVWVSSGGGAEAETFNPINPENGNAIGVGTHGAFLGSSHAFPEEFVAEGIWAVTG